MDNKINSVLLIDDDRATNFLNKLVIEKLCLTKEICVVENGREALEFLKSGIEGKHPQPDLIFLDINIPIMNGWEFLEAYRKLSMNQRGKIIIIMLTTSLNPEDQTKAENMKEVSGFRKKPLSMHVVNEIVEKHFK
jgi:CheY-like chemotaxis protein